MIGELERVYPGRTSLIQTGRGPLTLQTEITGCPPAVVTILDFRGRVLKTFRRTLPDQLEPHEHAELANRWHAEAEAEVHATLAGRTANPNVPRVVARLFIEAMVAYRRMDRASARAVLRACDALMPGDSRIGAALIEVDRGSTRGSI
ncbi:hypothetical protein ACNOYE_13340 [Nannocystaceae bacterium ST9]